MRKYELVFILKAGAPEGEMDARLEKAAAIIGDNEGEATRQDHWGLRRLAYENDHETQGDYMLVKFNAEAGAPGALDRYFRMDDKVLRHLVVVDEEWAEKNRAAQAKRNLKAAAVKTDDN